MINRLFNEAELNQLRSEYNKIERIDPAQPYYTRLIKLLDNLPASHLNQLAEANIKFVSILAKRRIN